MMTMFILFAVLYFWHAGKRDDTLAPDRTHAIPEPANEMSVLTKKEPEMSNFPQISTLYHMGQEVLKSEHLEGVASVSLVEDKAVKIILTSDILFDSGEAELKGRAVEILEKVGRVVKEIPYTITVAGHTDNAPINTERFPSNWELSAARACVTARFLIDHMFAPAGQVRVTGYAEFLPVRPNDDVFARALNRRVEIFISKENHHGIPDPLSFNAVGTKQVF